MGAPLDFSRRSNQMRPIGEIAAELVAKVAANLHQPTPWQGESRSYLVNLFDWDASAEEDKRLGLWPLTAEARR